MESRERRRRLDSLNLDSPDHAHSSHAHYEDVEIEGRELYLHFFHERLRSEGLRTNDEEDELGAFHDQNAHFRGGSERRLSMNLENFASPIWRQTGRDLQQLADRFARSRERQLVRLRADQVDVATLDVDKFKVKFRSLLSLLNSFYASVLRIRDLFLVMNSNFFEDDVEELGIGVAVKIGHVKN